MSETPFHWCQYDVQEMLDGKYPIQKILEMEIPVFPRIKGVPPVLDFKTATGGLSVRSIDDQTLAKRLYVMCALETIKDYIFRYCPPVQDFLKRFDQMLLLPSIKKYYESRMSNSDIEEDQIIKEENLMRKKISLDPENIGEKNDQNLNNYSTQDKIKFASYFFIALGILGTVGTATLAILSSQRIMELSLKSAAFLVPAIASLAILLISAIVAFAANRSQKETLELPQKAKPAQEYYDLI